MSAVSSAFDRLRDQRGEVFPVAILFGGVLLTILVGVHVVLVSVGRTAVQAAADQGVTAAQSAPPADSSCGTITRPIGTVTPDSERYCAGLLAAWAAMSASGSMVATQRPPAVSVDEGAGVVAVYTFGTVLSPVLGAIEVVGRACGPLDAVSEPGPVRADMSAC
ncbi:hypothetical protein [Candidatus Poriferisodalis sp.]|uniref:hypothetical protein n=1 Tax=Candidatus Poriferisodalis sp. TaxID=3101277 RepID=UPI003AF71DBD